MAHMRAKLAIAAAVVLPAVAVLAVAGLRQAQVYYLEVDRFLAESRFRDSPVRLCGAVGRGDFEHEPATLTAEFTLLGRQRRVPVVYRGALPELFQPGTEVVVEGQLSSEGVFQATRIMTRCASKYRPDDYVPASEETP